MCHKTLACGVYIFESEIQITRGKQMRKFLAAALIIGFSLITPNSDAAVRSNAQQRAQEIAAHFNKSKHKVKEKYGVRVEKFLEIRSELALKRDARDYAGTYIADFGTPLNIQVAADGRVEANGSEPAPGRERRFTLRDARIEGALLTATKVYDDGTTEKFEGVFLNMTTRTNLNDTRGTTVFGLGVFYDPPKTGYGFVVNRLFYTHRP